MCKEKNMCTEENMCKELPGEQGCIADTRRLPVLEGLMQMSASRRVKYRFEVCWVLLVIGISTHFVPKMGDNSQNMLLRFVVWIQYYGTTGMDSMNFLVLRPVQPPLITKAKSTWHLHPSTAKQILVFYCGYLDDPYC